MCDILVSKFAFNWGQLVCHYGAAEARGGGGAAGGGEGGGGAAEQGAGGDGGAVGRCTLNQVDP
jgi:hypothetical protein